MNADVGKHAINRKLRKRRDAGDSPAKAALNGRQHRSPEVVILLGPEQNFLLTLIIIVDTRINMNQQGSVCVKSIRKLGKKYKI